jgi:multidrug efflux pump subunit AcrA (membrane-fusion protein)
MIWIAALGLALAVGAAFALRKAATAPASAAGVVKYQCPMHPQIVRDAPGDCPICHMHLEKVSLGSEAPATPQGGVEGRAAFQLDERRRQLIGVKTEPASSREVFKTLRLPGRMGEDRQGVLAQALEMDAPSLRSWLKAEVRVAGDEPRKAVVSGVEGTLDQYTRSFAVYLQLVEPATASMRGGVYCDVRVALRVAKGLSVPREALFDTGDQQLVYVSDGQGRFEPRKVVAGKEGDLYVEIKQGLKEGEVVVTSANFLIDSESRFKAAASQF